MSVTETNLHRQALHRPETAVLPPSHFPDGGPAARPLSSVPEAYHACDEHGKVRALFPSCRRLDKADLEEIEQWPVLEHLATRPRLDLDLSADTESRLPDIAGGLSVALGRAFRIIDPKVKNPQSEQRERCIRVFNELL
jgi:hypothetical protein